MRLRTRPIAAALLLAAPALLAAQPNDFEGVVTMKVATEEGERVLDFQLRKGKLRMEMTSEGQTGVMVFDGQKMLMLMPAQNMYMEMPATMGGRGRDTAAAGPTITRTGRMETIAGWQCEHWLFKDERGDTDVCVAKGLGTFFGMGPQMGRGGRGAGRGGAAWQRELRAGNLFPLKVTPPAGTPGAMEVTKIEKKSLDASLFEVPKGYTQMQMPMMPGMGRPPE